jgi:hypothetical protein
VYRGQFVNNVEQGLGNFTSADGSVYLGEFAGG